MAVDVVPASAPENKAVAAVRGIPSFYHEVMAEMRKVRGPSCADVRATRRSRSSSFVLLLGLSSAVMDVVLQRSARAS